MYTLLSLEQCICTAMMTTIRESNQLPQYYKTEPHQRVGEQFQLLKKSLAFSIALPAVISIIYNFKNFLIYLLLHRQLHMYSNGGKHIQFSILELVMYVPLKQILKKTNYGCL